MNKPIQQFLKHSGLCIKKATVITKIYALTAKINSLETRKQAINQALGFEFSAGHVTHRMNTIVDDVNSMTLRINRILATTTQKKYHLQKQLNKMTDSEH